MRKYLLQNNMTQIIPFIEPNRHDKRNFRNLLALAIIIASKKRRKQKYREKVMGGQHQRH